MHFAARAPNNVDVVIRIMAIGGEGQEHLAIQRALSAPDAQVPENRTVPMIAELEKDDIVFGIFPLMWDEAMRWPWFETVRQLLDALEQVLEVLRRCPVAGLIRSSFGRVLPIFISGLSHTGSVKYVHYDTPWLKRSFYKDFAFTEVFSNYGRGWDFEKTPRVPSCTLIPHVFRSRCPDMRYMINDFELSVQFAPESDLETRLVSGVPIARYGGTAEQYGKHLPPEALLDIPYCPFKADMYQVGMHALKYYQNVQLPELLALFTLMASDDPKARPTAAEALTTFRGIRKRASQDVLNDIPVDEYREYRLLLPGEICPYCDPHHSGESSSRTT
ncbi:hypothetical protein AURDEDRAFT_166993 [Auricularia subglabra TFB-10046 SS5]|nr:hypothetical protein AURDEDRAFT_166993 [Auricularia subglabra TFB-10046 SS5]